MNVAMASKYKSDDVPIATTLQRNNSIEQRSASELRKVVTQNVRERVQCETRTNAIDRERKSLRVQLDREEQELRAQLGRLELEKLALDDAEEDQGELLDSDTDVEYSASPEQHVINPYPITIGRAKQASTNQNRETGTRRRIPSASHESTEGTLPPLHSHSRYSLVSARSDVSVTSRTSMTSRSDMTSLSCVITSREPENPDELWVGNPEAIQSVRRARKSVAQQRTEAHAWKRSRSLKEKSRPSQMSKSSTALGRSQSLRDAQCGGRRSAVLSPSRLSRTSSHGSSLSRSPSLQEVELQHSIECLVDPATEAELNRGPVHRCLRRHLTGGRSGNQLSQYLGSSPDTKSTVWGWIRDNDASSDLDESTKSGRIQEPEVIKAGRIYEPEGAKSGSHYDVDPSRPQRSDTDLGNIKLQRKSSNKRRPPRPLASMSADCVGIMGNTPLVPSPSHLSVEKCYELLAATPIGAPKSPPGILPPKLAPIPSGANSANT